MPAKNQSSTLSLSTYPSLHTSIFGDEGGSSLFGEGGLLGDMGDIFNSGSIGSGVVPGTSTMSVPRISSFTQFSNQASTTFQPHQDRILQGAAGVGTSHLQQQNQHQHQHQHQEQKQPQQRQQQHTPFPYRHSVPIPIQASNNTQQEQQEPQQLPSQTTQQPRPQTMYAQGSVADLQKERILSHKASVATMMTVASTASSFQSQGDHSFKPLPPVNPPRGGRRTSQAFEADPATKAQRQALKQQLKQQQKAQQKKSLPLFPTERTRGASSIQNALRPVDITQIDLLPIEVSHKIIMNCIDEIKLRGLKHKHLFRSPFYSPSVEGALALMVDPRRQSMVSVKWMRMDTVAGLLTTALSRTYPPLIPPHIQELFQNPNGRFFFELLGMLPELNRFLFVEILDLCCDLVDNQLYNQVSHSKLAIYPGSCCFGLDEFMPTWDTRYLLTTDVKKFSAAFYHVIYAYREERDLSAEALQEKLDTRDRIMEKERMEALESEYGLEGTFAILRMEARIAKGLPAESPQLEPTPPSNTKEISVYANRKEKVVADDAISVLDIQLDENGVGVSPAPALDKVVEGQEDEEEEENVERVIADLRRSVSVATLVYNSSSSGSNSAASSSDTIVSSKSMGALASTQSAALNNGYFMYNKSNMSTPTVVNSKTTKANRPSLGRLKSLARFSTIEKNLYPVSPGDIFGISRHAIERKELQEFLSVARTSVKQRKSLSSKRILQLRLQNKMFRRQRSAAPTAIATTPVQQEHQHQPTQQHRQYRQQEQRYHYHMQQRIHSVCLQYHHRKLRIHHPAQNHTHWNRHQSLFQQTHSDQAKAPSQRRGRTRQLRKELQVYLDRGLSQEDAIPQNKKDKQRRRRKEKKAKAAALKAVEKRQQLEKAMMAAAEEQRLKEEITMEEAEVMEAFDYLTDQEFAEFITLAGLTMADVDRIREKAATAALKQVTKDIASVDQSTVKETLQQKGKDEQASSSIAKNQNKDEEAKKDTQMSSVETTLRKSETSAVVVPSTRAAFEEGQVVEDAPKLYKSRPTSLPKMTSMDLLLKNARVIGDSNLRCYPELTVSTPTDSTISSGEVTPISTPSSPATTPGQTSRRPSTIAPTDLTTVPEEDTPAATAISLPSSTSHSVEIDVVLSEISVTVLEPKTDSAVSSPKLEASATAEKSPVPAVIQERKKKISPSSSSSSIPVPSSRAVVADATTAAVTTPARTTPSPIAGLKNKSASSSSTSISSLGKSRVPLPSHDLKKKLAPTPQSSTETTKAVKTNKVPESMGVAEMKKKSVQDAIKALEGGPKAKSGVRDAIKAFEMPAGADSSMGSKSAFIPKLRPVSRTTTPVTPTTPPSVAAASSLKSRDALKKTTTATTTTTTLTTAAAPLTSALKPKEDNRKSFVSKLPIQPSTLAAPHTKNDTETSRVGQMKDDIKVSTTKVNPTKVETTPLSAKNMMTTSITSTTKSLAVSRPKETASTNVPATATVVEMAAIPQFVLEIHTVVDEDKVPQTEQNEKVPSIAPVVKNKKEEQLQMLQVEDEEEEPEDEDAAELRELLDSMSEEERSEFLRLSRA